MDIVINNFFSKEMSIMNFFGLDAIISTVHTSFEVFGTCEDLWIAFLLRHFGSCYIYRRRQLDCKDDMEKPASVCLNCAFSALAMLQPIILLQFKTLFTNSSVDILFSFDNSLLDISHDYLLTTLLKNFKDMQVASME